MLFISLPTSLCIRKVRDGIFLFNEFDGQSHIIAQPLSYIYEYAIEYGVKSFSQDEFNSYLASYKSVGNDLNIEWLDVLQQGEQLRILKCSTANK